MKKFEYQIKDEAGIHARPAGMLVNKVKSMGVSVTLIKGEQSANASRLFAVMGLGVRCGDTIEVRVEGENEEAALAELVAFFEENL